MPIQWGSTKEIYIPNVDPPSEYNISDFHPIALLNVESKLFKSLGLRNRTINNTVNNLVNVELNALFVSGWPETIRLGPL